MVGVMKPEDGLRKLRGMESTTGIWTMRCVMIVERKNLVIIDKGNGVRIIEKLYCCNLLVCLSNMEDIILTIFLLVREFYCLFIIFP